MYEKNTCTSLGILYLWFICQAIPLSLKTYTLLLQIPKSWVTSSFNQFKTQKGKKEDYAWLERLVQYKETGWTASIKEW